MTLVWLAVSVGEQLSMARGAANRGRLLWGEHYFHLSTLSALFLCACQHPAVPMCYLVMEAHLPATRLNGASRSTWTSLGRYDWTLLNFTSKPVPSTASSTTFLSRQRHEKTCLLKA